VHSPSTSGDCTIARTHKEVWHLISDVIVGGEEATHASPPDKGQQLVSTTAMTTHHQYMARGHFQLWAKISIPKDTYAYQVMYLMLICK